MTQENLFSSKMAHKTEDELRDYLINRTTYQEAAVEAAIRELENRNLASEEIIKIEKQIVEERVKKIENVSKSDDSQFITNDPNAPLLYRGKFMVFFGALFSVLAGGILLAINAAKIGKSNLVVPIIIVSLIYTVIQGYILTLLNTFTYALGFPISMIGVIIIENLFWKRNVDSELKYRKRPIWGAIIIASIIWAPIIYLNIVSIQN